MNMGIKERLLRFRSFWIFPGVAGLLIYFSSRHEAAARFSEFVWLLPAGILIWTLLEYGLHRCIFHARIPVSNLRLRGIVTGSHMEHHASPRDPRKILVHPLYGLAVSSILYGLLFAIFRDGLSTAGVIAGVWTGFLYYEAVHYRVHFSLSGSGLLSSQRRAHFHHHFTNNKTFFGVTSPLWDFIFGTMD
jgi:sterol desaturase/sphingolipid hydroxylase (fatty acid hydroxylase superfamily)